MLTLFMILLAVSNGLLIVAARLINARLGQFVSWSGASIWNHVVGFGVLVAFFLVWPDQTRLDLGGIPPYLLLGGVFGAVYVAVNNWLIPKIGAAQGTILVIAGQIGVGTLIDFASGQVENLPLTLLGMTLIVTGLLIGRRETQNRIKCSEKMAVGCTP